MNSTGVYTPSKRFTIANTWIGAIVGAIPPMMGWVGATNSLDLGAWVLASVLYAWQFPHFNSLAWNLRKDYSRAGYMMMSVVNPALNARVALRYSLLLYPISFLVPYLEITSWGFLSTSSLINSYMAIKAYKFWKNSDDASARQLFFASLVHLPIYLCLLMLFKTREDNESQDHESQVNDKDSSDID